MSKRDEGIFVKWYEKDFSADDYVAYEMNWLQRLLYRCLCQKACWCSTRPDLPNDDKQLARLSGSENLEMWLANKDAVLYKFTLSEDGTLWSHKRIRDEYQKTVDYYAGQEEKANKRWKKDKNDATALPRDSHGNATVMPAENSRAEAEQNKAEEKQNTTQKRVVEESRSRAEGGASGSGSAAAAAPPPQQPMSGVGQDVNSGKSGSGSGSLLDHDGKVRKTPQRPPFNAFNDAMDDAEDEFIMGGAHKSNGKVDPDSSGVGDDFSVVVNKWEEVWHTLDCHDHQYDVGYREALNMVRDYAIPNGCSPELMVKVIKWLPHSNHWGKTQAGALKGLKGFVNAYRSIVPQYKTYMEKVSKRNQKKY